MTDAPEVNKFTTLGRILHWLTAVLVFAALFVGFVMVNSVGGHGVLVMVHKTLGALVLLVMVVRVINRMTHRPPAWPPTIGALEGRLVGLSEKLLYALLLLQPLVGWAMLSAAGGPVVVFGLAAAAADRTVRRAAVLDSATSSFGDRLHADGRDRRPYICGAATHPDTARSTDRANDFPVSDKGRPQPRLG